MRTKQEVHLEIDNLARSIGVDSYECTFLNAKIQQISSRIQGSIARMQQLDSEKTEDESFFGQLAGDQPAPPPGMVCEPDAPFEEHA